MKLNIYRLHDLTKLIEKGQQKKKKCIIQPNTKDDYRGFVVLSVDALYAKEKDLKSVYRKVTEHPQTAMAFINSTEQRLYFFCRYTLPDGNIPPKGNLTRLFHRSACHHAWRIYQSWLEDSVRTVNIPVTDIDIICPILLEENIYENKRSEVGYLPQPLTSSRLFEEGKEEETLPLNRLKFDNLRSNQVFRLFNHVLRTVLLKGFRCDADGDWLPFVSELAKDCYHNGIPEEDAVKWILLETMLEEYKEDISQTVHLVYSTARGGFGTRPGMGKEQLMVWQMEDFLRRRYVIRHNVMKNILEYRELRNSQFHFELLDEYALNTICIAAQKEGIGVWDKDVKRFIRSNMVKRFFPLEDYLSNLPEWDGKDHILNMAARVPCDDSQWRTLFRVWFLSMVAHWTGLDEEHANALIPQLVGKQGCGKSTFCRNLLPPELREYYTDTFDLNGKRQVLLSLTRYALINLDEFDSISAGKQPFLKNLLQTANVKTSLPYQSAVQGMKRYASFIGTSNNFDLLTDPTGSRRFICVESIGNIDTYSPIDHGQLYAQARSVEKG